MTIINKQVDVNVVSADVDRKVCGNTSTEPVSIDLEVGGAGLSGGASLTWSAAPAQGVTCNVPKTVTNAAELSGSCSGFPDGTEVTITFTLTKDGVWAGEPPCANWVYLVYSQAGSDHLAQGRTCPVGGALSRCRPMHACSM